jgi:hypothetical protein
MDQAEKNLAALVDVLERQGHAVEFGWLILQWRCTVTCSTMGVNRHGFGTTRDNALCAAVKQSQQCATCQRASLLCCHLT